MHFVVPASDFCVSYVSEYVPTSANDCQDIKNYKNNINHKLIDGRIKSYQKYNNKLSQRNVS